MLLYLERQNRAKIHGYWRDNHTRGREGKGLKRAWSDACIKPVSHSILQILQYYQSTRKAHAKVLLDLVVRHLECRSCLSSRRQSSLEDLRT